jgi:isopenicillin N synthase-like dioxygenase
MVDLDEAERCRSSNALVTDKTVHDFYGDNDSAVPIIDLLHTDHDSIVQQIASACGTIGFFHVINHGISTDMIQDFRYHCKQFFTNFPNKDKYRRNENNSRGYFDNEYTKQRLDWKYALDVGVPGSRDWDIQPDNDERNRCLDGYNQLPNDEELPNFRSAVISYFDACANLSHRIATLMTEGILLYLQNETSAKNDLQQLGQDIIDDLYRNHTSYLRMNYYPPCPDDIILQESKNHNGTPPLGISPHRDAGFLTILLQDDDCYSLQVPKYTCLSSPDNQNSNASSDEIDEWRTVIPVPGGLTINTGDMAQIWSNGIYKAPLHRVLTHPSKERFSAPFFYNPGYSAWIQPIGCKQNAVSTSVPPLVKDNVEQLMYHPCLWGYFRAIRFAGDVTDLGVEIQVEDFLIQHIGSNTKHCHIEQQHKFINEIQFDEPFSVHHFRQLFANEKN